MNSLPSEPGKRGRIPSRWLALAICLVVTAISTYWAWKVNPGPSQRLVTKAEDEVYEAVVRELLLKVNQEPGIRLVFDDTLVVGDAPWLNTESCRTAPLAAPLTDDAPRSDAGADRPSQLLAVGLNRMPPSPEAVENYRKMSCTGGRLSRTFRIDVPHSFVDRALFDRVLPDAGDPTFARLFPGASGVIGFSHAGFNKQLDEALVSTSFHCGVLCGSGHRYFLKKVGGRWTVVSKVTTWVS